MSSHLSSKVLEEDLPGQLEVIHLLISSSRSDQSAFPPLLLLFFLSVDSTYWSCPSRYSIMLAGIIIQLIVMIAFTAYLAGWTFFARLQVRKAGSRMQLMLGAIFVASIAIIVRGVRLPSSHLLAWSFTDLAPGRSATVLPNSVRDSRESWLYVLLARLPHCLYWHEVSLQTNEPMIILDAAPVLIAVYILAFVFTLPSNRSLPLLALRLFCSRP
jgi:hypothetical protein